MSHDRFLSIPDYFIDRWERASLMGFGKDSSVYDSCLVLGDVRVGENTWIGPYTILDGSGEFLKIGNNCTISAGVQIYTHNSVDKTIYGEAVKQSSVEIGNNCYIGPNSIVTMGVKIGNRVVIGANSLVTQDIPDDTKTYGLPAKEFHKI